MNILETRGLSHDFKGLKVISGVNLQVMEGERHAIIGHNGAGKTTLFNLISGAIIPRRGKILFKGRDVTGARPYRLTRMGMGRSFQITSTFSRLTAFENIRMGILSKKGIRFSMFRRVARMKAVTEETDRVLRSINLYDERDVPAGELSYGKHRSLEVGMAVATDPDLVILDEPTAGMSREETLHTVSLIRRLTEGRTMVIIEHDMDVVFSIADRITVLHHGEILVTGTPREIRDNPEVRGAYLGDMEN
jgi:branched-chain amino acid transport system ATP-binding protein